MPRIATIFTKGEHGKREQLKTCVFDDDEWGELRGDWLAYLESGGTPAGGAYKYRGEADKAAGELLLRFDDVLAVT